MQLNIKPLGDSPRDNTLDFSFAADLSHLRMAGEKPFCHPVAVRGRLERQIAGILLAYTVEFTLSASCARCLSPTEQSRSLSFTHLVMETAADEDALDDGVLYAPQGVLDGTELVASDLLLSLDSVILCEPGCKGLCPKCGCNRNEVDCSCDLREPDPRFDVLRRLMES